MASLDDKELKKLYYTIGEVAKIFDVNASLIRFWEKEFNFTVSKKNKKGNRLFTVKNIQEFNKIYHLVKVKGHTLDGARKALLEAKKGDSIEHESQDILEQLEKVKSRLLRLKGKI